MAGHITSVRKNACSDAAVDCAETDRRRGG